MHMIGTYCVNQSAFSEVQFATPTKKITQETKFKTQLPLSKKSMNRGENLRVFAIPHTFKLVKDAIIFIQGTKLAPEVVMDTVHFHRLGLHV